MKLIILTAVFLSGCYDAAFSDCAIACMAADECPNGFYCDVKGWCRADDAEGSCDNYGSGGNDGGVDSNIDAGSVWDGRYSLVKTSATCSSPASQLQIVGLDKSNGGVSNAYYCTGAGCIIVAVAVVSSNTKIYFQAPSTDWIGWAATRESDGRLTGTIHYSVTNCDANLVATRI